MKEILTVVINLTQLELEAILEKISMDWGTTKTEFVSHHTAETMAVTTIPTSCTKLLNRIEELSDKYGVEYYQGLKVVLSHNCLVTACYLVQQLKKRSIRCFDKNLKEFI